VSDPPPSDRLALVKLLIQGVLALVLLLAMTWIVVSPVSDEASKAALVIVGSTIGFLFGRHSS
jgi:hypothetical protein